MSNTVDVRMLVRCLFLTASMICALPTAPVAAQTTDATFAACYVPAVGVLYMIEAEGLASECVAPTHVRITWSDGGVTLPDGSVLTPMLADGSVTEPKLAFDPATQAELAAVLAALSAAGTINDAANPIDWSQLKNVPTDFADGTDNSGGTPGDLACTGCVGSSDIEDGTIATGDVADGAIAEAKLAFDPATQSELDALDIATQAELDALDTATQAEFDALGTAGTINDTGNPVDWTQLKSVPAGFADGTDDGGVTDHAALTGLAADDHPQYLLADGVRNVTDGFAVTGSINTGTIPTSGDGVRMMWYPGRAAFRAGEVSGSEWDDANIGQSSTAMGFGTTASGLRSTAMGSNTTASTAYSTALGSNTTASGQAATAVGFNTIASGFVSTAMGSNTTASNNYSTAMGSGTTASGIVSTAMGQSTSATGNNSTTMGSSTIASGVGSTAIGVATTAQAYGSLVIGRWNEVAGNTNFWISTDPLFVVGNGTSDANRSNALTLLKNGNLTIAGTLTESSDIRLKEDIEPIERALDGVLSLTPIRYRFREGTGHPSERQIGLSAQEVEQHFPELVTRDAQGYLSVAYADLSAVLVRAMQEQQQAINDLIAENRRLAARLEALERR